MNYIQYVCKKNSSVQISNECSIADINAIISQDGSQISNLLHWTWPNFTKVPYYSDLITNTNHIFQTHEKIEPNWLKYISARLLPIRNPMNHFAIYQPVTIWDDKSRHNGCYRGIMIDVKFDIGINEDQHCFIPIYSLNPTIVHWSIPNIEEIHLSFFKIKNELTLRIRLHLIKQCYLLDNSLV